MIKYLIFLMFLFNLQTVSAQGNIFGNYIGEQSFSDSIWHKIELRLNSNHTYEMVSTLLNSKGTWKLTGNKIKLKPNFSSVGCFIIDNKAILLQIEGDSLNWKGEKTINEKNLKKRVSKIAGEVVKLEFEKSNSIVFKRQTFWINRILSSHDVCEIARLYLPWSCKIIINQGMVNVAAGMLPATPQTPSTLLASLN